MADAMDVNNYEKRWMTLLDDGQPLGIFIDGSAAWQKEVERLRGYIGYSWRSATNEDLKRFRSTIVDYEVKRQKAAEKLAAAKGE